MVVTQQKNITKAKPFLKWAGGKTQLLPTIKQNLPLAALEGGTIKKYVEPFVGSGAVLFEIMSAFPQIEEADIYDINPELINVYKSIQYNVEELVEILHAYEDKYIPMGQEERKLFYYAIRKEFNNDLDFIERDYYPNIKRAAQFIFLNRTCFNGLYRVNKKGEYNVPMGQYKNPTICNEPVLIAANAFLKKVRIHLDDYRESQHLIDESTFVYLDPPYRPISKSSSFTSYSKFDFNDTNQIELRDYFKILDKKNAYVMLSNSDPKNNDISDNFFDNLYEEFHIQRVNASRRINSKASNRGEITELLIKNY
ncbi:Dam family site-specific DNA-(adenine-N6)-methyltransferase [Virgibacillus sp. 179-BFC.A HS]|uniref:site-specific DNA-methyltransferase (adenine-specific) n=1 Tax=Tigheibacillus jepli TaxID=3035914 RepID=A0ABU5CEC5_9BACI|nr:Dam family site-specific DNA-(adenine-N6)-methyltransferase [Virgibacillus sp. 179-BFC.A HS]MDY0404664.1 Dam family site-specific DNA-(adenine-N6)-methyltransferase [Virgibacillus sp. 179-BFC.A HS]